MEIDIKVDFVCKLTEYQSLVNTKV